MPDHATADTRSSVRIKPIALPAEHGSWGFVLEPILLGLLVAPSWGGLFLALGAFAAFLLRRPARVIQTDWRRRQSRRATVALWFLGGYGATAALCFVTALLLVGTRPLVPLLIAVPFLIVFTVFDVSGQSRSWQAELAGPVAFATVAASIGLAAGWPVAESAALAGVIIARAVPSVLYIRARLRLDKQKESNIPLAVVFHVLGLAGILGLIYVGWLPMIAAAAFVLLLARAAIGLSRYRRPVPVKTIGFMEVGFGVLTILTVAVGYWEA
jgi:hypothetical protein